MSTYVPRLTAEEVDARLLASLRELRTAEQSSFLWFVDIMNRRLFRKLGYSTVQQYATERLDFSRSRMAYFVRLASEVRNLPGLHAAMTRNEIGWSKAVLLLKVATRGNEKQWIEEARTCGRRELARRVKAAQLAAVGGRAVVDLFAAGSAPETRTPEQGAVAPPAKDREHASNRGSARAHARVDAEVGTRAAGGAPLTDGMLVAAGAPLAVDSQAVPGSPPAGARVRVDDPGRAHEPVHATTHTHARIVPGALPPEPLAAATEVRLRLTPTQRGRYEALLEKARKLGARGANPELVLEALTVFVLGLSRAGCGSHAVRGAQIGPGSHAVRGAHIGPGSHAGRGAHTGRETHPGHGAFAGPGDERTGPRGKENPTRNSTPGEEDRRWNNPGETPAPSNRLDAESAENGLQSGVLSFNPPRGDSRRTHLPIYQVYVRTCEECSRGWMETSSGPKLLDFATLRAILCDARVSRPGEPNRHSIPPLLRRQALERDHYRCRAAGCGSHRFLNVHHLHAKEDGGKHTLGNVLTLCGPCHSLVHALRGGELALRGETGRVLPAVSGDGSAPSVAAQLARQGHTSRQDAARGTGVR